MAKYSEENSAIMTPFLPTSTCDVKSLDAGLADAMQERESANITDLASLDLNYSIVSEDISFKFVNEDETLKYNSSVEFERKFPVNRHEVTGHHHVRVISIFAKIGDGKSHTLNHSLFEGLEMFKMSSEQGACTKGVNASYQSKYNVLCFDTEGMPGSSGQEYKKTRLLWKIFAISDIVIFRTRSEKLQDDMFLFLGNALKAYNNHFSDNLNRGGEFTQNYNGLKEGVGAPAVIIFHETVNTRVLTESFNESAVEQIKRMFTQKNLPCSFRTIKYLGLQTKHPPTDYKKLKDTIQLELDKLDRISAQLQSPRQIYENLERLNAKFSEPVTIVTAPFSTRILECSVQCEMCREPCRRSMNHENELRHANSKKSCTFDLKYENKEKLCRKCYNDGEEVVVMQSDDAASSYAITNYFSSFIPFAKCVIITCPNCGVIFKSSSSKQPEETYVYTKIVHVWPGQDEVQRGPIHSGQKVIDSITWIRDTVTTYTAVPVKKTKSCINNITKPEYWRCDEDIHKCHNCKVNFEKFELSKHHCRDCGEVFCNSCSKHRTPVPHRGWMEPSRVCDDCNRKLAKGFDEVEKSPSSSSTDSSMTENNVAIRQYREAIESAFKPVGWVYEQSRNYMKKQTRPDYWIPDEESPNCHICNFTFGDENIQRPNGKLQLDNYRHHCRACGFAICSLCSRKKCPVPDRGWHEDVRICDTCFNERKTKED